MKNEKWLTNKVRPCRSLFHNVAHARIGFEVNIQLDEILSAFDFIMFASEKLTHYETEF